MTSEAVSTIRRPTDAELGRAAARELWQGGLRGATTVDPLTPEFARAAVAALEDEQRATAGALREALEGARMSAEQLNVEAFHGLIEVIQNADDLHASEVRVAVQRSAKQSHLLIVHDGERVELQHVISMTLAFVSTKRDDPRAKGRFGIGLKTLGRLGKSLTVHCAPYDFTIEGNEVRAARPSRPIAGFYDPAGHETMLDLALADGFDVAEFQAWFAALGSESMIFLDTVRSLRFAEIGQRKARIHHRLSEVSTETLVLPGIKTPCRLTTLRAVRDTAAWQRYEVEQTMPASLERRYKARDRTTPVAIAVPSHSAQTQIYAGLPLGDATELPFSLNAQFDIDVARRGIQHEDINVWLFDAIAKLTTAVALHRFAIDPARAWSAVPLAAERAYPADAWISDRIAELIDSVQARVQRGFRLQVAGEELRLSKLAYEAAGIEGLLGQPEVDGLRPGDTHLPRAFRDPDGRWRDVLAEIGAAGLMDVGEALQLLDWSDDQLGVRDVRWFIKLARAAIDADLEETLWSLRAICTLDGLRIIPPLAHVEGELLLRSAQGDSIAARLGLAHVIDSAYLTRSPDAVVVRTWLEELGMLRDAPDPEATLRALAARPEELGALFVADAELSLLRDALAAVDPSLQEELGLAVGLVIAVEVQRWVGSKRVIDRARPAEAYLPASIEDRPEAWGKAAGRTPEISWIHPRYKDVLRRPGRRVAGSGKPRPLAARGFFGLLGTGIAPRLCAPVNLEIRRNEPAALRVDEDLAPVQIEQLGELGRYASHLKNDWRSPDLLAVLANLQAEKSTRVRRERARALVTVLKSEWAETYAPHAEALAVFSSGSWRTAGTITATWLAHAMDARWLSDESGHKRAPRELAVRTPATEAVYGDDPTAFADELDASDALAPAVRALGIATDPQVSEMIEDLVALRDGPGPVDERRVALLYAAIGAACPRRNASPDDLVGDISLRKLRARFASQGSRSGLVYANGSWLAPSKVLLGAPVLGRRRAFVSGRTAAEKLWRALKIGPPSIGDCLDVLAEIAKGAPGEDDEKTLVNTYLYLEARLESASKKESASLTNLPLWNGQAWRKTRPVYLVADQALAQALSSRIDVWMLPVAVETVPKLRQASGSTLLTEDEFDPIYHADAFVHGAAIERQFGAAVEVLHDWLTRHDPSLLGARSAATSWEDIARARIGLDPRLEVQLRFGRRAPLSVPARAHVARDPLTFFFADGEAPGEDDAGGRVVAGLFPDGDRDKLALAWSSAWQKAGRGARGSVALVEDDADDAAVAALFEQSSGPRVMKRAGRAAPARNSKSPAPAAAPSPVRRLKTIDAFTIKAVDSVSGNGGQVAKKERRRGLRDELPAGRSIDAARAPQTAPLAYSNEEREELALRVLQVALNSDAIDLRDFRHLRGVGADAVDGLGRFFEIKASFGALPDDVTLTANEAERAFEKGNKFFLAVVAGLEEGYDGVVKCFPNPLRTLAVKSNTSVTLGGIRGRRSALEVHFTSDGEGGLEVHSAES